MFNPTDTATLYVTLAFLAPGPAITHFKAKFLTGLMQKYSDTLLAYFSLPAICSAIALPIID